MKYDLEIAIDEKLLHIEAKGRITFNIGRTYTKTTLKPFVSDGVTEGIYDIVNAFLGSLQPYQEQCLIDKLVTAKQYIDSFGSSEDFTYRFPGLITEICSCKGALPTDIQRWVDANVSVPSGIMQKYDSNDETYTLEQTYLARDYLDLVGLTVIIKMISPVVADYLFAIHTKFEAHSELETLRILPDLIKTLPGFIKLETFTRVTVDVTKIPSEIIYRVDMSEEVLPEYILANVLLSRLLSGTVLTNTNEKHLVTHVHRQLFNKQKVTTSVRMKDKGVGKEYSDEDGDGIGPYDVVRFKEKLSKADQVKFTHVGDPDVFIPWLVDMELLDEREFRRMLPYVLRHIVYIKKLHYTLLQSLFMPIIPYRAIIMFDKDQLKALMLAAHLILRKSHPYLSLIIISSVATEDDGQPVVHPMVTRSRLTKDLTALLMERRQVLVSGSSKHPTVALIEDMSKELVQVWLILLNEKHMAPELLPYMNGNQVVVREDGKKCIAEFMLGLDDVLARPLRDVAIETPI